MRLKNIKGASDKIKEGKYFIINPNEYKGKGINYLIIVTPYILK